MTSSFDFVTSKGYRAKCEMSFTCLNDGIDVHSKVTVPRSWPTLPRVGLRCFLDSDKDSNFQITWFGNGPHETYSDRQDCGIVRMWRASDAEAMHTPYIYPSSNGNRTNVRWMGVTRKSDGASVLFVSSSGVLNTSVSHASDREISSSGHEHEIQQESGLHVMLDHEVMGVGGDNSWEPCVHDKYLVPSGKTYTWGVSVIPMRSETTSKRKKRKRSGKSKKSSSKKQAKIEVTNDDEAMAMRREALRVRNEGLL